MLLHLGRLLSNVRNTGEKLENFVFEGEIKKDGSDFTEYGNMNTGNVFLQSEKAIRLECIHHGVVYLLGLMISSDKTHVVRTGLTKLWPVYLTICNFNRETL